MKLKNGKYWNKYNDAIKFITINSIVLPFYQKEGGDAILEDGENDLPEYDIPLFQFDNGIKYHTFIYVNGMEKILYNLNE